MSHDFLSGKKILLGITGGIAAYKTPYLVREFIKRGAEVKVVMTEAATQFVTPVTLATLSKNEVIVSMFPGKLRASVATDPWHIELSLWADVFVVVPATVNTIAKIVAGIADNPVTTLVTARRAPLIVVPAADVDMYEYSVTQANLNLLKERGIAVIPAESGELASGLMGAGRLPDNRVIIDCTETILSGYNNDFAGKKILVTAGPTYEDIDPVRYLGNRSSGKMGYALARALYSRGAEVTLISGPSTEYSPEGVTKISVRSAEQMKSAVADRLPGNEILIMAAAVADFLPATVAENKIKKGNDAPEIKLTFAPDILSSVKDMDCFKVGFALETDNARVNALDKMKRKNLDMIVLNSPGKGGTGFEYDTNQVSVLHNDGTITESALESKYRVAHLIADEIKKRVIA